MNSALKSIQRLPIIDYLVKFERYVASQWAENVSKGKMWEVLNVYASRKVDKVLAAAA